jgi:hypothetical protein
MPLSLSTLSEIRTELANLHQLKVAIDERTRALEAILVPLDLGQVALPFLQHGDNGRTVESTTAREATPPPSANTGLRAAILDELRKHGPRRAPEVAKRLAAKGFTNDSSTPLSTRVYNDLWRMSQKGVVTSRDGVFELK